jgi:hypothetical protein
MSATFAPRTPDTVGLFTIARVEQRTVNKRDGTSFTMYDVFTAEQQPAFATTKREIAESAFDLINKVAELHYTVRQNGNYTNFYVNQILPPPLNAAQTAQRAQEASPLLAQAAGLPQAPVAAQGQREIPQGPPYPTDRDRSIFRQTAAKVAATLPVTDGLTFWENVEKLAAYFETGQTGVVPAVVQEDEFSDLPF